MTQNLPHSFGKRGLTGGSGTDSVGAMVRQPDGSSAAWHAKVWRLAFPSILANLTVPLLGAVDTIVIGNLSAAHIGAVAVGAAVFSFLYWALAFLRMVTTGLVAQAEGSGDWNGVTTTFGRAMLLALFLGTALIVLQVPIIAGALALIAPSDAVEPMARTYVTIRIWGAPAALANMVLFGLLLGLQRAGTALFLQVIINGANILLDVWLALDLGWEVAGVAWATLIAQYIGLAAGIAVTLPLLRRHVSRWDWPAITDGAALTHLMVVNRDLFLRTLCVITALTMFTAIGARLGDLVLAANGILVLFQMFLSNGLDGFAHAAEALIGRAVGRRDRNSFRAAVRISTLWAVVVAVAYTVVYAAAGPAIVGLITDLPEVRAATEAYLPWAVVMPLVAVWSFQLDGIFIGATRTRDMRNAMWLSSVVYIIGVAVLVPILGNHGLWLAFVLFMAARALTLLVRLPRLEKELDGVSQVAD